MRELRGPRPSAAGWCVIALLLAAGGASAAPGSAQLVVQGPLDFDGPVALDAAGAYVLLRDPGTPDFAAVALELSALRGTLDVLRLEHVCVESPGLARTGHVAVVDVLRPSRLGALEPFAGAVQEQARAALDQVPLPAAQRAGHAALDAADTTIARADAAPDAAPLATRTLRSQALAREPDLACFEYRPVAHEESVALLNLTVRIVPTDPYYTALWEGQAPDGDHAHAGGDAAPGTSGVQAEASLAEGPGAPVASLRAPGAEADVLTSGKEVTFLAEDDVEFWSLAPRRDIPEGLLAATAASGRGALAGDGLLTVYRAQVTVAGVREDDGSLFRQVYETGERREEALPAVAAKRVLEFLRLEAAGAAGTYASAGEVLVAGEAMAAELDGALRIPDARGEAVVDDRAVALDGGPAVLEGALRLAVQPAHREAPEEGHARGDGEEGSGHPAGAMLLALDGDVTRVESPWMREEYPPLAGAAAAASVLAVLAGLLAYFWPALKFAVTPLYTRIPPDAVLLHGARESIYRLIREEPGIHAHEVSARLDMGWGTTVYHLKLLERNGLVVARHEGRYKRFFITGDQRLQHKEAVALLRNATSKRIAETVAAQPGLIQKQVCQNLDLSPSLASWHLQRLEAAGVVTAERLGRSVRYLPGPAWTGLQEMATTASPARPAATVPAAQAAGSAAS